MKHFLLAVATILSATLYLNAQSDIQLTEQVAGNIYLKCTVENYQVNVDDIYTDIHLEDGTPVLEAGAPDVEKLTTAVIVDDQMEMQVTITHAVFEEFTNVYMHPSKGNLLRIVDPATVPYNEGPAYTQNAFYPGNLAALGNAYVQHQFRGQAVHFYPVQYNPVTHVMRIFSEIEVEITPTQTAGENPLPATVSQITNATFREVYNDHFINYSACGDRYDQISEIGNMLVISDAEYFEELEPWIQWKKEKGIDVEVVDVATINSVNAISNYVENYYNTNGLTYLMLVGDEDQVPVQLLNNSGGQGYCDACYGYINGNDSYSEIFVGHFLVHNDNELPAVIAKTLEYEKNPSTQLDWFSKAMGIGSNEGDGIGDDNQADWQHQNGIKEDLLSFTYTEVWEKYDGGHTAASPTGGVTADASGAPSAASLTDVIEGGCTLINYTGHGAHTLIVTGSYTNTNINALQNNKFYPYFIVVGCCTGDYDDDDDTGDTFGEAWLKSPSSTTLTGGIGGSFSSVYQSWAPPMEGQDEMNRIIADMASINTRHTFGSIHTHGCAGMNDAYGAQGDEMTDTWILMGDPTVQLRTAMPVQIVANHPSTLFIGSSEVTIGCNVDDALVCLTIDGEIIATGLVAGGSVTLNFDAVSQPANILVTATSFNTIPYQGTIELVPAQGPYVVGDPNGIDDAAGNGNGQADYNETILLNVGAENIGIAAANNVNAVVTCSNGYVVIDDGSQSYGNIAAGTSIPGDGAFSFHLNGGVEDMTVVVFVITYTDGDGNTWTSELPVTIHAPSFQCVQSFIFDDSNGNGDGQPDSGETITVSVTVTNSGSAPTANDVTAWLSENSEYITIVSGSANLGVMQPGATTEATFEINVAEDAPDSEPVLFTFGAGANYYNSSCNYPKTINLSIEDWETGDDNSFPWSYSGNADWYVTNQNAFEGDYCMRSGSIGNNAESVMNLTMNLNAPTTVSFMYKVSSEQDWDYLRFSIDNVMMDEWTGEVDWTEAAYEVGAGSHTFKWSYEKDPYLQDGLDAAFVDFVAFNPTQTVQVDEIKDASAMQISPNPFQGNVNLKMFFARPEVFSVSVVNAQGQLVYAKDSMQAVSGMNVFALPGESWAAGVYTVNVKTEQGVYFEKIVRQ